MGTDNIDRPLERLREQLEARCAAEALPSIGISIGTAAFDPAGPVRLEVLLAAADAAMYVEKHDKPGHRR